MEGCNGRTTCGAIPKSKYDSGRSSDDQSGFFASMFSWFEEGTNWRLRAARREALRFFRRKPSANSGQQTKRDDAVFEAGCGQSIIWSTMHPIEPDMVASLGKVESLIPSTLEDLSNRRFETDIEIEEEIHKQNLEVEFQ